MKSVELRKGNYVYQDGEFIKGITTNSIHKFDIGQINLTPIDITEEWLIKLGFIHDKTQEDFEGELYFMDAIQVIIVLRNEKDNYIRKTVVYFYGYPIGASIHHIHHLQNLIYAYEGIEIVLI